MRFAKKHGNIYDSNYNNKHLEIINAEYGYEYVNYSISSHPEWSENMESGEDELDTVIKIGGFPFHVQDDIEFDETSESIILRITNSLLRINIATKTKLLKKLDFSDLIIDVAY